MRLHVNEKESAYVGSPKNSSRVEILLVMMRQRECRGYMDMPFLGMIGNPGSHLDQA